MRSNNDNILEDIKNNHKQQQPRVFSSQVGKVSSNRPIKPSGFNNPYFKS